MRLRFLLLALLIAILIAILVGRETFSHSNNATASTGHIRIVASFYPLTYLTQRIGGDLVQVTTITPAGTEPHDYEPTPQDIIAIYKAKLFIYNGSGLDAWANHIFSDVQASGVHVLCATSVTELLTASGQDASTQTLNQGTDPHTWLDPVRAQQEAEAIRDSLINVDPQNQVVYEQNASRLIADLQSLDSEYSSGLAQCTSHEIVTSHDAFAYLSQRYGLSSTYISGLSPDAEPSPKRLAEVVQQAKAEHIQYIFFETLVNSKLAETLAQEVGATTLVFNPLEGLTSAQVTAGEDYLSIMRENLQTLRTALHCL